MKKKWCCKKCDFSVVVSARGYNEFCFHCAYVHTGEIIKGKVILTPDTVDKVLIK